MPLAAVRANRAQPTRIAQEERLSRARGTGVRTLSAM